MIVMKAEGAFLTIGEVSAELGVPQHILRYWESRFPQLKPLQRSGNRRYYRPADVALARRIQRLLNIEGFTVRGAQKALGEGSEDRVTETRAAPAPEPEVAAAPPPQTIDRAALISRLEEIRDQLAAALG